MEYFWKENRKYLIAVGAGALAVLLVYWWVIWPTRDKADQVSRKRQMEEKALVARMQKGVAQDDTIGLARIELKRTRELLVSLAADMTFPVQDRYVEKPEGQSWVEHFHAEKLDVARRLKDLARPLNHFPDRWLSSVGEDVSEELARELLLRLAVVERLVQVAVEAKVDRIDAINLLPASDVGASKDEPVTRQGAFLNAYTVHMAFKGDQQQVFKVLHGIQQKGRFLAVSHFEVDRRDPTRDYLDAVIRVSLLKIDEQAPLRAGEEDTP